MRVGRTLASGLFGAALVLALAGSPASAADGVQHADVVGGSGPDDRACGLSDWNATACFEPYGEWFWLKDEDADGIPVAIRWWYSNPGYPSRSGVIYNDHGKAAGWTNVNKSFEENGQITYELCAFDVPTKSTDNCWGTGWSQT
ncbi:hypothetical protein M4D73_02395 [Streptomyces pseudogriseolus]|uniref:hypothetical protein n=1 Tax=Streptomyces pseudogriseolus TaxID=36817 RepID=UPI003FA235EE|nr:hypothetical protein [Streptomyces pseudogriseolus]